MPRLTDQIPQLRHHRASRRAYVTLGGKRVYCGPWNVPAGKPSRAAIEKYNRVMAEYLASQGNSALPKPTAATEGGVTVLRLVAQFWKHCRTYYKQPGGGLSPEAVAYRHALKPLVDLYGRTPAADFGPLSLKAVRETMIGKGWGRKSINRQVLRIRSVFRWAAENELLPATIYQALLTVKGLRAGRCEAKETAPVPPVDDAVVEATLPFLSPVVRDMVKLQRLTGARPGEICDLRGCDIDTSKTPWEYRPAKHKTAHHGHDRVIFIGPKARAIIEANLKPNPRAYLFQPSDAELERKRLRREARQSKVTPSQAERDRQRAKRRRRRPPGAKYDTASYRRAIARACERLFIMPKELREPGKGTPRAKADTPEAKAERRRLRSKWRAEHVWHPHQLRHTAATEWRAVGGPDTALTMLGDKTTRMIDVYAARDHATAGAMAEKIG